MRSTIRLAISSLSLSLTMACATEQPHDIGRISAAGTYLNGTYLNGTYLNGTYLNGTYLNGTYLNGTYLNGTYLNGTYLNGTALDGTLLEGDDFLGATISATLGDGTPITLRIDAIDENPDPRHGDVWLYTIAYTTDPKINATNVGEKGATATWDYLCGVLDDGTPYPATFIPGRWDMHSGAKISSASTDATISCYAVGAISKCVDIGYKPWTEIEGRALDTTHQACTRMIRADYCGDGQAWTLDGTVIDVYDGVPVQSPDENPVWDFEAEWGPDGVLCMARERIADLIWQFNNDGVRDPACMEALQQYLYWDPNCGDWNHFDQGTEVMNNVFVPPDDGGPVTAPTGDVVIAL